MSDAKRNSAMLSAKQMFEDKTRTVPHPLLPRRQFTFG